MTSCGSPAPFAWPDLCVLSNELVPASSTKVPDGEPPVSGRLLSDWDNAMATAGQFAGGVIYPETLVTPLLKESLGTALAALPFFAGRAVFLKDGRLDVASNNAGARFVAASTSATLADVLAAMDSSSGQPYSRTITNPWMAFWPPHHLVALVQQQWPLAAGYVLHLSGGGSVLWAAANHCLADFESLQTLAAHWAAAYNAALTAAGRPSAPPPPAPQPQPPPPHLPAPAPPTGEVLAAPVPPPPPSPAVVSAAGGGAVPPAASSGTPNTARAAAPTSTAPTTMAAAPSEGGSLPCSPEGGTRGGYLEQLPADRRFPRMSAAEVEALAEAGSDPPAPADLPPRREVARGSLWSGLAILGYLKYHLEWRGGGIEVRSCRVSGRRLAELKARATLELQQLRRERAAACRGEQSSADTAHAAGPPAAPPSRPEGPAASAPAGAAAAVAAAVGTVTAGAGAAELLSDVSWVSTNDALVGRLLQVLHSLPLRSAHPLSCFMAANVRPRLQPPLPPAHVGNLLYSARLGELRPSGMSLGLLAGLVRRELTRHLVPQFRGCLLRSTAAVEAVGPQRLTFAFCLEPDPVDNIFAPEGPINLTSWSVDYQLWQFGPSRPLAFLPLAQLAPCVILSYPEAPGRGDGGVVLVASMHKAAWRQLDAKGLGLAALL